MTKPVAALPALADAVDVSKRTRGAWRRRLLYDRPVAVGLTMLGALTVAAVAAPLLAPYAPDAPHYANSLQGPGGTFLLGTDNLGRDELSRLLYGARISLGAVSLATLVIMAVGVTVGLVSGYYGGLVDDAIQRVIEVLMAFPSLVLALAIAGTLGPSITSVVIAVVAVQWVGYARLVRGMVLALRKEPFVEAAISIGARDRWIIFRHLLPGAFAPVIVLVTLEMGDVLLTISSLSFLGLGAQPPTPEWGTMLNQARPYFESHPSLMIVPGLAITAAVLAFNLVGDGLRDALDPHSARAISDVRRSGLFSKVRRS